jgi:cell division inhibitor SulA
MKAEMHGQESILTKREVLVSRLTAKLTWDFDYLRRSVAPIMCAWMICAILATLVLQISQIRAPFTYERGFVSADVSVEARAFAEHGILKLGGVPVNNNGHFGPIVSAYTHWPPLLAIVLSFCFRIFGDSEITGHALMLVTLLLTALGLFLIARGRLSRLGTYAVVFSWLTFGVIIRFSHLISQQSFAVLFAVFSVFAFCRAIESERPSTAWKFLAPILACLAVWASWEALFVPVGLLVSTWWSGDRNGQRLAKAMALSAAAGLVFVVVLYAAQYPQTMMDALRTVSFRMGISSQYTHARLYRHAAVNAWRPTPHQMIVLIAHHYQDMLGVMGISAVGFLILSGLDKYLGSRIPVASHPYLALMAPWVFWYSVMWEHVALHNFELLIAAPLFALAMGCCFCRLLAWLDRQHDRTAFRLFGLTLVLPFILFVPLAKAAWDSFEYGRYAPPPSPEALDQQGRWIGTVTPENAIIIQPDESMVPVYYSRRHTIRNVVNDKDLSNTLPLAIGNFPGAPIYLALTKEYADAFRGSAARYPLVASNSAVKLYCLTTCPSGPAR